VPVAKLNDNTHVLLDGAAKVYLRGNSSQDQPKLGAMIHALVAAVASTRNAVGQTDGKQYGAQTQCFMLLCLTQCLHYTQPKALSHSFSHTTKITILTQYKQ
jgi:hypothetical protein